MKSNFVKGLSCVIFIIIIQLSCGEDENLPPPCSSEIYCHGRLLDTVQMAKIYEDSKTFVDMKMKYPPEEILANFDKFMENFTEHKPSRFQVKTFVLDNFEGAGQEFEKWIPDDWVEFPKFLEKIRDDEFREWGKKLNEIWQLLGKKLKKEVEENQDLYSIIWVPNPVIVPGGRFREFYYWDSYWIILGLLLSEMTDTAKGMLENFLYIVDNHGHIPNGGRIYYLARSQPPMLVPMIKEYVDYTKDPYFVRDNIHILDAEFQYWMTNHTKTINWEGKNLTLAVYGDRSQGPRPESYSEDITDGSIFKDQNKKEDFYSELKAAAESGWDFSSRWFINNATNKGNLTDTKIRSIMPVDLNSLIYWNAVILSDFHASLNNTEKVQYYNDVANQWLDAVTELLWHDEVGAWLDYDMSNSVRRDYFYPTNIFPLFTGCYKQADKEKIVRKVMKYLETRHVLMNGGIPMTMEHTGEQWDYPNAWPPMQHIMIVGLNNTQDKLAQRLAFEIAERWIRSNYKAFKETDHMYEKYDATVLGGHGGGGEYEIQLGFGWTNGIIMDLLNKYGSVMRADDPPPEDTTVVAAVTTSSSAYSQITPVLLALLVSLTAGFIGVCIYRRRTRLQSANNQKSRPSTAAYKELRTIPPRHNNTR